MEKRLAIKKTIFSFLAATVMLACSVILVNAQGSYDFTSDSGLKVSGDKAGFSTGATASTVDTILSQIIYTLISLLGVIFFSYLIYGALIWMTARDNEEKVKHARETIVNSLFGIIITMAAYVLSYSLITYFWK